MQTVDLLRAQADEIRALREQVESLRKVVSDVVGRAASGSGSGGDGNGKRSGRRERRPVDPIDLTLSRGPGRPRTAPGSMDSSPSSFVSATTTSSSSSSSSYSPSGFFSASSSPCGQLTTPPATPHRDATALGDGPDALALVLPGFGSGTVSGLVVPSAYAHANLNGGMAPAQAPMRAGSWHGLVRRGDAGRRKRRGALPVLELPLPLPDEDEGDDADVLLGRSQVCTLFLF